MNPWKSQPLRPNDDASTIEDDTQIQIENIEEEGEKSEKGSGFQQKKITKLRYERDPQNLAVLLVKREESLQELLKRLTEPLAFLEQGNDLLIVFPKDWNEATSVRARKEFFSLLAPHIKSIFLATQNRVLRVSARERGMQTFGGRSDLHTFLRNHQHSHRAVRHLCESQWQETLRTTLVRIRTLSVHRFSIIIFLCISAATFFTILFVALPSATIRIWPTENLVSHTANVVLIASGTTLNAQNSSGYTARPKHVLPLLTLNESNYASITFTEISKKFLGVNAETEMTIINETDETYSFIAGTRLVNQAGMVFRLKDAVSIPAATHLEPGTKRVNTYAAAKDLYGQIIGDRGNIPGGLKWEFQGLPLEERQLVYARNPESATGGVTRYGQELQEKDIELAEKQLKQRLISDAKMRIEERVFNMTETEENEYVVLQYDVLTGISFSGITLPTNMIGQEVQSAPVSGGIEYTALAYNKDALLELLLPGLLQHVEDGKELINNTVVKDGISVHVIEYDDDLRWVKITAELTGKQRSILGPKTKTGRLFIERVREMIQGKTVSEAMRIIQNLPEADRVQIGVWPPWKGRLPSLMSNIVISPQL